MTVSRVVNAIDEMIDLLNSRCSENGWE